MKKETILITLCLIAAALVSAPRASAQQMPDSIFNDIPHAFANTIQDVPPDILAVEIEPAAEKDTFRVSAKIWVDPDISKFRVSEARACYISASSAGPVCVEMSPGQDRQYWWAADLKTPAGESEVEIFIRAKDEIGNEVVQLPVIKDPGPKQMILILEDGPDEGIPASLDILNAVAGYDGENLTVCSETRNGFQSYSELGANAFVLGFIPDDVRLIPSHSITENTSGFIANLPTMGLNGIFTLDSLAKGGESIGPAEIKTFGTKMCMKAAVNHLTPAPERGLKIYTATGGLNAVNDEITLGDATPYVIVYFGGRRIDAGDALLK